MSNFVASLLVVVGLLVSVTAAFVWSVPVGFVALGVSLVVVGVLGDDGP